MENSKVDIKNINISPDTDEHVLMEELCRYFESIRRNEINYGIKDIVKKIDSKEKTDVIMDAIEEYFIKLNDEDDHNYVEPHSLVGFCGLMSYYQDADLSENLFNFIKSNKSVFLDPDHSLKEEIKYAAGVLTISDVDDQKELEDFWYRLWTNSSPYWEDIAFIGLFYSNYHRAIDEFDALSGKDSNTIISILKSLWGNDLARDSVIELFSKNKKKSNFKEVYSKFYYSVMDFKDRDDVNKEIGIEKWQF